MTTQRAEGGGVDGGGTTLASVERCTNHNFEIADRLCGDCGRPFCHLCLVTPFRRKPPLCHSCAVAAAGIRKGAKTAPVRSRREIKAFEKERRQAEARPEPATSGDAGFGPAKPAFTSGTVPAGHPHRRVEAGRSRRRGRRPGAGRQAPRGRAGRLRQEPARSGASPANSQLPSPILRCDSVARASGSASQIRVPWLRSQALERSARSATSFASRSGSSTARIWTTRSAALSAPSIATVATGMPRGIWTVA